jgi:ADP-ribose pyrophosphatase
VEKPEAHKLGWQLKETALAYKGRMLSIRDDQLRLPEKEHFDYEYVERAPGVIIVPVTAKGEIVLIRQYRYPVDMWCLETPAGGLHDTGDTPLEDVVRKELHEEIGAEAGALEHLGRFFPAPSYSTEICDAFIAWDVKLNHRAEEEVTEEIDIRVTPAAEAVQLARTGRIITAVCALAVLWSEERLRARNFI